MKRILRINGVIERYGKSRSPIYADIKAGVFVRPFKLGSRAAGWDADEVEQLVLARIRGDNDEALRKLVRLLHEARKQAQPAAA